MAPSMSGSRLIALASLVGSALGVQLDLVLFKDRAPEAVCMDGTSSGYWWRKATSEAGKNMWVVFLQSGGWCWDTESCAERKVNRPDLWSSDNWVRVMPAYGLLSDTNEASPEAIRTANKVFVGYCTSDAHMGDAEAFGLQFRGQKVMQAVMNDLIQVHGLGKKHVGQKDFLLFGGGSAGGRGAMMYLDYIPSMLGAVAPNVDVAGFLDSPLWIDMPLLKNYSVGNESLGQQTKRIYDFANVRNLDDKCAKAYPNEEWKCMFGEYRIPFIKTPYVLVAALHDAYQLWWLCGGTPQTPWNDLQLEYAHKFAERTAVVVKALRAHGHVVVAQACNSHSEGLSDLGYFGHSTDYGITMNFAVNRFMSQLASVAQGPGGASAFWVDDCRELNCGGGCHRCDDENLTEHKCWEPTVYGDIVAEVPTVQSSEVDAASALSGSWLVAVAVAAAALLRM